MKIIFLILQIIFLAFSCGPSDVSKKETKEEIKTVKKYKEIASTRRGEK